MFPERNVEMSRYDLSEFEWRVIAPLLPSKPRGVARVDDRRVLNGIFWVLRSGSPWRDLPERYGPYTTCYNRNYGDSGITGTGATTPN
jgi:transposase